MPYVLSLMHIQESSWPSGLGEANTGRHLGASCDFRILESEKVSPVLLIWAREAMVGCGVVVCAQATHLQWDQDT